MPVKLVLVVRADLGMGRGKIAAQAAHAAVAAALDAAGLASAGLASAGLASAELADAGLADAGRADAGLADAGLADAKLADARLADASLADAGRAGAGRADFAAWLDEGQPKVVLKVTSAEQLAGVVGQAAEAGLPVEVIRDAGRTQLPPGTVTCAAIGPAPAADIDAVTGDLSLL